jgi:hypothetical protein
MLSSNRFAEPTMTGAEIAIAGPLLFGVLTTRFYVLILFARCRIASDAPTHVVHGARFGRYGGGHKMAEFLVHGRFPWELVRGVGVLSERVGARAMQIFAHAAHRPPVQVKADWYY